MPQHTSLEAIESYLDSLGDEGEEEMVGHLIEQHAPSAILQVVGAPWADILSSKKKRYNLQRVIDRYTELALRPDSVIKENIVINSPGEERSVMGQLGISWGVTAYRYLLIQSMKFMEENGLGTPDWLLISEYHPDLVVIPLDIARDSFDPFIKFK